MRRWQAALPFLAAWLAALGPPARGQAYDFNATRRARGSPVPWPQRLERTHGLHYLTLSRSNFLFELGPACQAVERAIRRYDQQGLLFDDSAPAARDDPDQAHRQPLNASLLTLHLRAEPNSSFVCDLTPGEHMDEHYRLQVEPAGAAGQPGRASIWARSGWGLMRGLETFSQLVFALDTSEPPDHWDKPFGIYPVRIEDWPRFSHRGFMVDTSRHYLRPATIELLLDAMAAAKLNVFHWHLVDDQAWPWQSSLYPQLAEQGAYTPRLVYSRQQVEQLVDYARARAIRVVAELDTPGHTYAMRSIAGLLTECFEGGRPNGKLGPLDPSREQSYGVLGQLFGELAQSFPDPMVHAGGDEVDYTCWRSNPNLAAWMRSLNLTSLAQVNVQHMGRVRGLLAALNKTMLVWQEVFDDDQQAELQLQQHLDSPGGQTSARRLALDAVVHVWKDIGVGRKFMAEMARVTEAGHRALLSSCWYLNYIDYGRDWAKFYACDPRGAPVRPSRRHLVLGGEVCMWGEFVDDTNVVSRSWPRAGAAAERLWSAASRADPSEFVGRLEQLRCRLLARGLPAEPINGPGYC